MTTKVLSFALVLMFVTLSIPSESDAWGQIIREGLRRAGEWINSPSGQKTFRDVTQNPKKRDKIKETIKKVQKTASDVKNGLQEGWREVSSWDPACVMCGMAGRHMFCDNGGVR